MVMTAADDQFRDAIAAAGLNPPDRIEPGRFHRFPGEGKRNGNRAGWCKLFSDGLGGIYGDHSTVLTETWQAKRSRPMSLLEREAFRRHVEESKQQAVSERERGYAEARMEAKRIWEAAKPAPEDHAYLLKKGIPRGPLRLYDEALVAPIYDPAGPAGELMSLQFIAPDGQKRFLPGGKVAGGYVPIGRVGERLHICEGVADALSLHGSTGDAVAAALMCSNLEAVGLAMREKYPPLPLIFCADDDYQTEGNPGITYATKAAQAVGGLIAIPDFGPERPDGAKDWNDFHGLHGAEAVKRAVANARAGGIGSPNRHGERR
jgi:putative DNA primase/helicase